ncbi:hypothetical protein ONQ62_27945, partial [Salmonella enterica subsp. enterica serovar Virginia]|nr:hypothetical protein [Salmonella enterica subsp. enterica serovar Virginia]
HTSAIIVGDGQVLSAVNDVNDYAGPATGYRLQGERWEEIKNITGSADAVVVLENDLHRHASATRVNAALAKAPLVMVVDHQRAA